MSGVLRRRAMLRLPMWETLLAALILASCVVQVILTPWFLNWYTVADVSTQFAEKGIVALPLALLIIAGDIDISVASIMAAVSVAMGLAATAGFGTPALVLVGIGTGASCGAINGALVAGLRVPSIVATIGTMSLFRGAAYAVLGDRVIKTYPAGFELFGQGFVAGPVSVELVVFTLVAIGCGVVLHRSKAGRRIYAIGAAPTVALWSGIAVQRTRFVLFLLVGAACGLASVLLTSRLGSTRPTIAQGWELDIISMVILGGVAVTGGRGSMTGVVLSALLIGVTTFGLGLLNFPGVVMSMSMGLLLILMVLLPRLMAHRRTPALPTTPARGAEDA